MVRSALRNVTVPGVDVNRRELQLDLARVSVLASYRDVNTAVLLPTQDRVRHFVKGFYDLIDEVPDWLMPDIRKRHVQQFEVGNIRCIFTQSHLHLKGMTLNAVYRSDQFTSTVKYEQDMCLLPALLYDGTPPQSRLITFEDS